MKKEVGVEKESSVVHVGLPAGTVVRDRRGSTYEIRSSYGEVHEMYRLTKKKTRDARYQNRIAQLLMADWTVVS